MHRQELSYSEVKRSNVKIPEMNAVPPVAALFQVYFYGPRVSTIDVPNPKVELVWDFSKNVQIYIPPPDHNYLL